MVRGLLATVNRFNAAHPWSHNDVYHRWLLRRLPPRLTRTIDLGCGTGNLVRALAPRAHAAEGIDQDATVIATAIARQATEDVHRNVSFTVGSLMELDAAGRYDAVTAVAVIHHLPLQAALGKARELLAPHGTLIIIGCYRPVTAADRAVEAVAIPVNLAMGLWKTSGQAEARVAMSAPIAPIATTLAEVRAAAALVLPGASIRRRLFWRYSLVWQAPDRSAS